MKGLSTCLTENQPDPLESCLLLRTCFCSGRSDSPLTHTFIKRNTVKAITTLTSRRRSDLQYEVVILRVQSFHCGFSSSSISNTGPAADWLLARCTPQMECSDWLRQCSSLEDALDTVVDPLGRFQNDGCDK